MSKKTSQKKSKKIYIIVTIVIVLLSIIGADIYYQYNMKIKPVIDQAKQEETKKDEAMKYEVEDKSELNEIEEDVDEATKELINNTICYPWLNEIEDKSTLSSEAYKYKIDNEEYYMGFVAENRLSDGLCIQHQNESILLPVDTRVMLNDYNPALNLISFELIEENKYEIVYEFNGHGDMNSYFIVKVIFDFDGNIYFNNKTEDYTVPTGINGRWVNLYDLEDTNYYLLYEAGYDGVEYIPLYVYDKDLNFLYEKQFSTKEASEIDDQYSKYEYIEPEE